MITSMTGFGRGESSKEGFSATVEIKSLNSRYLDISTRLPQSLQHKELELKELAQDTVHRGKLNISVNLNDQERGVLHLKVDKQKVGAYASLLRTVAEAAGIEEPIEVKNITSFGDIYISEEDDEETLNQKWKVVKEAAAIALSRLNEMRLQEGDQLRDDLKKRIQAIDEMLDEILQITDGRSEEVRTKLHERIRQLSTSEDLDKERLEMEVVIMADKMDITEETVRLKSHLKFFLEAIAQQEPAGRRLNFLTQEINRELNTIGSKANDSGIAHHVVKAKEMLEQIREQVQNVE